MTIYKPLVISGPSGVGKGTIIEKLKALYPNTFKLSISNTTRKPRQNEQHGVHYYFVSMEEFQKDIDRGSMAEYCQVHDNIYGTHRQQVIDVIQNQQICILDIDVQGGTKIHQQFPDWNFIFFNAPSIADLEARLRGRNTENEQQIQTRLKNASGEIEHLKSLPFYREFVNDSLENCIAQLQEYLAVQYPFLKEK